MRSVIERIVLVAVLGGVLGALPLVSASAETVADVVSLAGSPLAEGADGSRSLAPKGIVTGGERIVTDGSSQVGLMMGDVYVQLDKSTSVTILRSETGAPSLEVHSGRVRLVDTSAGGDSTFVILTPDSRATGRGSDTEVTVSSSGTKLCEGEADLAVSRRDGSGPLVAQPGQCMTASGAAPLALTPAGGSRLALLGVGGITVTAVAHFQPEVDVAAPPPTIGLAPLDPGRRSYQPCDFGACMQANPTPTRSSVSGGNGGNGGGFGFNTGPGEKPDRGQSE